MRLERPGRWAAALTALFLCSALAQPLEQRLAACAGCHGADGNSVMTGIPSIAGQPRVFLESYLVLTREGLRGTEVMQKLLRGVLDRDIAALAAHFEKLPARPAEGPLDRKLYDRGRQVAAQHRCGNCHLPSYRGQAQMPRLAGQREEFLAEVMFAYRQNRRPGGDTIMAASLYGIPDADIKALAHFLAHSK